jgi:hypothetical protein
VCYKRNRFGRKQKMSLVASPHSDGWLSSLFASVCKTTAATTEEQQPLLYSPREAPETEEFMEAKREIEHIATECFIDVFTYRFVPREPNAAVLKLRREDEAMILVRREIVGAEKEIVSILQEISGDTVIIDQPVASRLIDHAIWALMTMVSMTIIGNSPYMLSCKDIAAAYVMKALLFPLKRAPVGGDSLLYKTVRESNFKFGPEILAAIASRNDQRFRGAELDDKAVIRLFKERYGAANFEAFVAK